MKKVLLLSLFLMSCAGGGGGGNVYSGIVGCTDSTATNYNSLATTDDGSCIGGSSGSSASNGNAAYYGVSTDSNTSILNQNSPPTGGTLMTISNQLSINIRTASSRVLDIVIYQPTCLSGSTTEEYSAVLVSGSSTSPMIGVIKVSASALTFQERIVSFSNARTSTESITGMYDYGNVSSYSGSCSSGSFTPSSGGLAFSNGKSLVWRTSTGDVYVGLLKNTAPSTSSSMESKRYMKYTQFSSGAINPENTTGNISTNSGTTATDTSSSASSFTSSFTVSSLYTWNLITNTTSGTDSTAQFNSLKKNSNNTQRYFGIGSSNLNSSGKALFLMVNPYAGNNSAVMSNLGPTGIRLLGAGSVLFYVEQ